MLTTFTIEIEATYHPAPSLNERREVEGEGFGDNITQ